MEFENIIIKEDLNRIIESAAFDWLEFKNSTIFITGATGLIGQNIVKAFCIANSRLKLNCKIVALVRNEEKAKKLFDRYNEDTITYIIGNVEDELIVQMPIDYIIHCASQTSSAGFINNCVETINTSVAGTNNMLTLALNKKVKGMILTSSMEVYGYPQKGDRVTEEMIGSLSPLVVRNCYPISKMLSESLCCSYASEYNVPVKIVRLTQTFGPGVQKNDNRIFAYLARCVINHDDIVLNTKGETERSYLYTADAVVAILTILLKGISGKAYNAADEETYCSISEMAKKVALFGDINVKYELDNRKTSAFANTLYMNLDTTSLKSIGWSKLYPEMDLIEMYRRLIESM